MNTTPKQISPPILALCKRLDESQTPVYVPVKPVVGAVVNECYHNVRTHIKAHNGSIQHGWIIWEHPGVIIEGNFHACWIDTSGQLIDLTPKQDREKEILFLPDSKRVYDGTPIDNVREVITTNPGMIAQLKLQEDLAKLRIKYNVDGHNASIPVRELEKIGFPIPKGNRNFAIDMTGRRVGTAQLGKIGRNDPCHCGSGLKFKKCCGK